MVLIHEAGHYTAAKILGFTVEEFAVGFGPKIFSRRRKNGELFSLRMLPLGGFCAFLGETEDDVQDEKKPKENAGNNCDSAASGTVENTDHTDGAAEDGGAQANAKKADDDLLSFVMRSKIDDEKQSVADCRSASCASAESQVVRLDKNGAPAKTFYEQKPWKRIIVLLGGVVFNFLSAIIFSLIYIWSVGYATSQITEIYSDPSGEVYCPDLRVGDVILAVDGRQISVMESFSELAAKVSEGETVKLKIDRDGDIVYVDATRREITVNNDKGESSTYTGFGFVSQNVFIGANAGNAFKYCVPYTFKLSWSILGSFGQLITGKVPITSVSGPIGSINMMAQLSVANWRNILILLPLLASNLAIFNLLPFPALDGAQVIFTIVEWIRKKPINRKIQGIINSVGLVVLLLFVLIVDILSFAL